MAEKQRPESQHPLSEAKKWAFGGGRFTRNSPPSSLPNNPHPPAAGFSRRGCLKFYLER